MEQSEVGHQQEKAEKLMDSLSLEDSVMVTTATTSSENCSITTSEVEGLQKPDYLECPLNWMQYLKCGPNVATLTTRKYVNDWIDVYEKRLPEVLRNEPVHYFLKKLLQVMYQAYGSEPNAAKDACVVVDNLLKTAMTLDESRFSKEYKDGLINLIVCTKKELQLNFGVTSGPRRSKSNVNPVFLRELTDKAKCPILAAKVYFCKIAGGALTYQQYLTKMIINYDCDTAEWFHLHHSVLRALRHQDEIRFRNRPNAFELQALGKASTLDPENQEIQASVLKTLFDCLKQRKTSYVEIGSLEFQNRDAIAEYLYRTVSDATMAGKDASVRALLAASQIIGYFRMPEGMRNVELAEQLLDKASTLWPQSSKILCRYANFLLCEKKDHKGAKEKFLEAMTVDPSDVVSTLNFFWLDSATNKLENIKRINETLKSKVASQWPNHVRLDLHFLKGCILISMEKTKEGLAQWVKAEALSEQYFLTKMFTLNKLLRKYSWKVKADDEEGKEVSMAIFHMEKLIKEFLENVPKEEPEDVGYHRLVEILGVVKAARSKPEEESTENSGRIVVARSGARATPKKSGI